MLTSANTQAGPVESRSQRDAGCAGALLVTLTSLHVQGRDHAWTTMRGLCSRSSLCSSFAQRPNRGWDPAGRTLRALSSLLLVASLRTPQPALADSRPCFLTNTSFPFCAQLGEHMLERSWRVHIFAPLLCHVANVFPSLLLRTLLSQNPRGFHVPFLNQKGRNMNCSDVCSGMRLKTHSRAMGFC